MKILTICTANLHRSVTLAAMLNATEGCEARSAGTHPSQGRNRITENDLKWADRVVVFEHDHWRYLRNHFFKFYVAMPTHNLRVPDEYQAMTPELFQVLQEAFSRQFGVSLAIPEEATKGTAEK